MKVNVYCPSCRLPQTLDPEGQAEATACPDCHSAVPYRLHPVSVPIERCPVCGFDLLYVKKDFPRKIGCLLVAIGAALSIPTHFISLAVVLALEAIAYPFVPTLTACYRCECEIRGVSPNPSHRPFEHKIGLEHDRRKPPFRSSASGRGPSPPTPGSPEAGPSSPSDRRS